MKGTLTLSTKEIDRLMLISQIEQEKISVLEASSLMELSQRQIYRILKRVKAEGAKGIIHKLRGIKSNRGYPRELKEEIIKIYKKRYSDYGPTLFSEMLEEYHNISMNRETLRNWLRQRSITTSIRKKRPHRRKRERRSCYGELLQFDGSHHDWFESRGVECCLLNAVDDATGRVYLRFASSENTEDVLLTMWEYVNKYGIPRSIYTDRGSVYYAKEKLTDFGRAMKQLNVELIIAKSPQAKGRVERFNRTLQDRLIKALRREGISNIAEANRYLQEVFINKFNQRFAVNPELPDVHRLAKGYKLEDIFCYKTYRQVRNDYTINLNGGYIQLLKGTAPLPKPKQNVTICKWLNGQMHIYFNEQELSYKSLKDKPGKKGYKSHKVPKDHPWRKMNQRLKEDKRRNYLIAALG
ncbi:MAG: ISNCY family transposase [Bacteroidetes bacterium]|nr:ISNCY family transposase [Bacteroidota bacterium]MCH7769632.1 ISNCY family transposase [Bacteroidota bacterium]